MDCGAAETHWVWSSTEERELASGCSNRIGGKTCGGTLVPVATAAAPSTTSSIDVEISQSKEGLPLLMVQGPAGTQQTEVAKTILEWVRPVAMSYYEETMPSSGRKIVVTLRPRNGFTVTDAFERTAAAATRVCRLHSIPLFVYPFEAEKPGTVAVSDSTAVEESTRRTVDGGKILETRQPPFTGKDGHPTNKQFEEWSTDLRAAYFATQAPSIEDVTYLYTDPIPDYEGPPYYIGKVGALIVAGPEVEDYVADEARGRRKQARKHLREKVDDVDGLLEQLPEDLERRDRSLLQTLLDR